MKQKYFIINILFLITTLLGMTSCGHKGTEEGLENEPNLTYDLLADFKQGPSSLFKVSDGYANPKPFNCVWNKDNVTYDESLGMKLTISEKDGQYQSGEIRTDNHYGFGSYHVKMKMIPDSGTCSSFFLYTGEYEGNKHNEIDIEFVGNKHNKVQFNYFKDGERGNDHFYDLGFDASKEFHDYGFKWCKDSITWYVDNKAVYKATYHIPQVKARIYMNAWCGVNSAWDWMGHFKGSSQTTTAYYKEVGYKPINE